MDTFWQDIKYALRSLGRQPGVALAVVTALTLGIGANTVMFSVVNAVVLNPLALSRLKDPGRVLMLWETNASLSALFANQLPVRPQLFRIWQEQARSFETMAAWRDSNVRLSDPSAGGRPQEQVESGAATASLFPLLDVRPRLGRNFTADEMRAGAGHVAILSDELYRNRFSSAPAIVGSTLFINDKPVVVIGVLPPAFALPAMFGGTERKSPKLWTPLDLYPQKKDDEALSLFVMGRLKDGISIAAVRAEMHGIESRLAKTPLAEGGFGIHVMTLSEANTDPDLRQAVLILQIAVGFVLLIACANAGNLLLIRAVAREREMAIRSAMGAGGFRLLRQTLTESVLLSVAAALPGLLLSVGAIRVLTTMAPPDNFGLHELRIDRYVLAFTGAAAVVSGILFGLVPAWHSRKTNINAMLNRSGRTPGSSSSRLLGALVVSEVALSLVLVIGAGLMVRTLAVLMNTDLGFQPHHLLVMRLNLSDTRYKSPAQLSSFNNRLVESVRSVKGIVSAALTTALPLKAVSQTSFGIPGRSYKKDSIPVTFWARVSDSYFETLQLRVLKGRTFVREEVVGEDPGVAIANEAFVKTFFSNEVPLGKLVTFGNEKGTNTDFRIVGVVANERQMGADSEQGPELYLPGDHLSEFLLIARTEGEPGKLAKSLREQVWKIDKDQVVGEVMTEDAAVSEWSAPRRFNLIVLLSFAAIAVLLAAMGIYTVVAYTVKLRTREIGIRIAIGAEPASVKRYILRLGLSLSLLGIAVGLVAALALTRFMASLIYGVSALDPATFASVVAMLLFVAFVASYIPAARATKINPVQALRSE